MEHKSSRQVPSRKRLCLAGAHLTLEALRRNDLTHCCRLLIVCRLVTPISVVEICVKSRASQGFSFSRREVSLGKCQLQVKDIPPDATDGNEMVRASLDRSLCLPCLNLF